MIVQQAKDLLGLHYRYGGTSPDTGFDCSGFTSYVLRRFHIEVGRCSRSQSVQGREVDLAQARPGDVIAFSRSKRGGVSHVALVVSNDENGLYMIHSSTSRGVVIENLLESDYWRPKIYAVRDMISDTDLPVEALPHLPAQAVETLAILPEQERQETLALLEKLPGILF